MAKVTLTAFAEQRNEHRQQVSRWMKSGRISPAPELGISPDGRPCFLVEETATILDLRAVRIPETV